MLKYLLILGLVTLVLGAPEQEVNELNARIVGGNEIDIRRHSYTVAIILHVNLQCGGVLIHPEWVVTSAQCVHGHTPDEFIVRAGSTNHNGHGDRHWTDQIIEHFAFNTETLDFDVALMHLTNPVSHYDANTIEMATAPPIAGTVLGIAGWGRRDNGFYAIELREVRLPIVSRINCLNAYDGSGHVITDRMLCVGLLGISGRGVCERDTGGPAVSNGVLVGIVSWSVGCGSPIYPNIMTDISTVRDWVIANAGL